MKNTFIYILYTLVFMGVCSCKKEGDKYGNISPDTKIVFESINLSGDARLSSTVRLSWYGTDEDGYIIGYEISLDNETWDFTTDHDSTFRFDIPAGSDSADIEFRVRAVDEDSLRDPDPAFLSVPIKNSPPSSSFNQRGTEVSEALGAATYEWDYNDPDGRETVTSAFVKINDGTWTPVSRNSRIFSVVPSNPASAGPQPANIYLGTDNEVHTSIDGFVNGDSNTVYVKVIDQAEAESMPDTSQTIMYNEVDGELLIIGGQPASVRDVYLDIFDEVHPNYDYLNLSKNQNLPRYWDPTFKLTLKNYDKVFFFSGDDLFTHPVTNQTGLLIGFTAPSMVEYTDGGGKVMMSTRFNESHDLSAVTGVLSIERLEQGPNTSENMRPDSVLTSQVTGFPDLYPRNVVFGVIPFEPGADAQSLYGAHFNNHTKWPRNTIASARTASQGKINEILFNVELYRLTGQPAQLETLFDLVFNDTFDW